MFALKSKKKCSFFCCYLRFVQNSSDSLFVRMLAKCTKNRTYLLFSALRIECEYNDRLSRSSARFVGAR